ncbi:iron ABC transporter permease [Anaerobacillus alkaliphilus]|uniref:Iron ABC transporter permease n=1 Tax=Anaerobacillus alkaliphilus TaxID=1548597 RepID=A0A4Q0VVU8_9BACI|nr:iron ABC transporter permease [Anaerobacillus alkaliphilus]RXJ02752.1 iron ABC transporter permease [Anaerobacillus alkaliphilus]
MSKFITVRKGNFSFLIEKKNLRVMSVLFVSLLITLILSIGIGSTLVPLSEIIQTLFGQGSKQYDFIILSLRLPRVLVAILIGAALGVSGAILQGVIRNPLASPDIIGITNGAAFAATAFIVYLGGSVSIKLLPLAAIIGAITVSVLIYLLAWKKGVSPFRLVLIGIGMATAMGSLTTFMIVVTNAYTAAEAYVWLTGSIYAASMQKFYVLLPFVLVFVILALVLSRNVSVQELGDDVATSLGSRVQLQRFLLVFISVILAGAAVAIGGAIGFVGLIAPHISRKMVGASFGSLIPTAALVGALLVALADLIGRTAFQPYDVPAGIFTAAIGAPFFIYLIYRNRNK